MSKTIVINYKGSHIKREVTLSINEKGLLSGKVGTARYLWDINKYAKPLVYFKDSNNRNVINDKKTYVHLISCFIKEYLDSVDRISPMHFEESTKDASHSSLPAAPKETISVSGVPQWMKDEHKEWKLITNKFGTQYYRRTRFKKGSKDLIQKFLPHCSSCPLRAECIKPCVDPEATVQAQ